MDFLFGFQGRIGRLQWWAVQTAVILLAVAAFVFVDMRAGWTVARPLDHILSGHDPIATFGGILIGILATWITVAATVKRYHDRDKAGWWWFVYFVPFVGPLWQLVECGFLSGTPGVNRFGQRGGTDPEALAAEIDILRRRAVRAAPSDAVAAAEPSAEPVLRRPAGSAGFGRRGL